MKILIIDSEMTRQRNLRSILSSLGYKSAEIDSADDPNVGISNMKKKTYNVVFMYREFPKVSGIEILQEIRSNARFRGVPIVLYSSEINKDVIVEGVQAGANSFLGYPFSVSDVESAMAQAIKAVQKSNK
jgi:CheY-like chemotaxis protein